MRVYITMDDVFAMAIMLITIFTFSEQHSTPVIGGTCDLGALDVQIGGKEARFFLRCIPKEGLNESKGIWVIKTRAKFDQEIRRNIPTKHSFPVCRADTSSSEGKNCTSEDICFQALSRPEFDPTSYLKCDQANHIWVREKCPQASYFSFEEQVCIEPRSYNSFHQYPHTVQTTTSTTTTTKKSNGILCTYVSCSVSNPCSSGSCNDGYCCTSAAPASAFGHSCPLDTTPDGFCTNNSHCNEGCAYKSYKICPGTSTSGGFCMSNHHCNKRCICNRKTNTCCCSNSAYSAISVCPNGGSGVSYCQSNNDCGSGCSCNLRSNTCCCQNNNNNGYKAVVICPGGSTSSGSCNNNNQCGSGCSCIQNNCCCSNNGYTAYAICQNGETSSNNCNSNTQCGNMCYCNQQSKTCCCGNNNTYDRKNVIITIPKDMFCLDGTQAVGACVNGQCGTGFTCSNNICCAMVLDTHQYKCLDGSEAIGACIDCKCGIGYFCTTGNLCCPSTQSICPIGQVAIGPCVNLRCPTGYTCIGTPPNTQCCGFPDGSTNLAFSKLGRYISCPLIDSVGPCIAGNCPKGYLCDTVNEDSEKLCCPDFEEPLAAIAPCENTVPRCPKGFSCKTVDIDLPQCFRLNNVTVTED
uniref:Chitin-binding type-2 domain-containing protein n=1 Tax=Acrobeloides nanus TaxID=290746 RepID=A0A914DVI5_9BILA